MNSTIKNTAVLVLSFVLFGCNGSKEADQGDSPQENMLLSDLDANASNPCVTKHQLGRALVNWTQELSGKEEFVVKYAVFDPEGVAFDDIITVEPSRGTSAHPKTMNKVAF